MKFALPLAALLASAGFYIAASSSLRFDRDHRLCNSSGVSDYMKSSAPTVSLAQPDLKILTDRMENDTRILRLNVRSARRAPVVMITAEPESEVLSSTIGEERIANQKGRRWGLRYYGVPANGLEITLELKSSEPVRLRVTDLSFGLPEIPGFSASPKPDYMMSSPVPFYASTLVSKSFSF